MRNPLLFFRIFRSLWSSRKGDHSAAHILRRTDDVMGAVGMGKGTGPAFSDGTVNALYDPRWSDLWKDDFTLTAAHLDLIKRAQLEWDTAEAGAPKLALTAPYAGGSTPEHLNRLLGDGADETAKCDLLISMVQAFSTYCDKAEISAGSYGVGGETVDLTDDLIALVRNLQWDWADEGDMGDVLYQGEVAGPRCDCKRPYGDMGFFALDMHRILRWEVTSRNDQGYIEISDAQAEEAQALHQQIMPALRAVLAHGEVAI